MKADMFNDEQLAHLEILQKETEDALSWWKQRALTAEATVMALTPAANDCLKYKPLLLAAEAERDRLRERLDQFEAYGFPNVATVLDRLEALRASRSIDLDETAPAPPQAREVEEAAMALRAKMRAVYNDARYMNVWATAQEHLGPYTGPNWIAETGATPDVAEEVSAVRHRIDNGRRCRDCGEAIGITAYADDLLDKFAQAPAPPAASDEVREAAERYRVASAAARDCRRAHATYRYETICDEKDERDIAAIALAEKLVAALSRPAAKGGDE